MKEYKAVILAGGKGTRLYPITYEIPKPLLPVNKKPIINYLVDLFFKAGIKDIAVLISKEFEEDFDWWQKRYYPFTGSEQIPKIKIFKEEKPLGTFGGLFLIKDWLKGDYFFMTNGDELKELNLSEMKDFHFSKSGLATVALVEVPNPQDYGVAVCSGDMIEGFVEKPSNPPSRYISSGLYFLSPQIFNYYPGEKFSMIETELFPKLAEEKKLAGFKFKGRWTDCGTWERYEKALQEWKK